MKKIILVIMLVLCLYSLLPAQAVLPKSRTIVFDYDFIIKDIPAGTAGVKIWTPYPAQNSHQDIEVIGQNPHSRPFITHDKTFANKILYFDIKEPKESDIWISLRYKIKRYEYSHRPKSGSGSHNISRESNFREYLKPNRLVTISDKIKSLANHIAGGKKNPAEKARAFYNYVFENVEYDKTIPGWGNGDTERVCEVKKGNCTDFHSLFISLARSEGIPSKFVMGIQLPKEERGKIQSYHCWAEFYLDGLGWVPVDISEAWKAKMEQEYYFGTLDENRIEFTTGRDIILAPAQKGEPLNYFIYPYVEINGKAFKNVEVLLGYRNINKKEGLL